MLFQKYTRPVAKREVPGNVRPVAKKEPCDGFSPPLAGNYTMAYL